MKVAVYSICKNELDQVEAYMDHLDALGLKPYVLDHSTDGTTERLRARGAIVDTTPIEDWWWDKGKNAAMDLVPGDCQFACNIDLDERLAQNFHEIVAKLEPDAKIVQHLYQPEGGKDRVRYDWRLHARHGARWVGPVHEYLEYVGPKKCQEIDELLITHWPPPEKNHIPVANVLRAVKTFPGDLRIKVLAGRELYFTGQPKEASTHLREYLRGDSGHEIDTCYAHRLLAKCYEKMGQHGRALHHYKIAAQFPSREARVDLAYHYNRIEMWPESYAAARQALEVTEGCYLPNSDPDAWGFKPHELLSIALYHCQRYDLAVDSATTALSLAKGKDRLRMTANLQMITEARDEAKKKVT